jgi:hypothetical protein
MSEGKPSERTVLKTFWRFRKALCVEAEHSGIDNVPCASSFVLGKNPFLKDPFHIFGGSKFSNPDRVFIVQEDYAEDPSIDPAIKIETILMHTYIPNVQRLPLSRAA